MSSRFYSLHHGLPNSGRLLSLLAGMLIAFLLGACATPGPTEPQDLSGVIPPGDVDKLLVVDCLLPGTVRRLGRQLTYLTPRRPIKTSAGDCEIRGGEYVAYDRADYRTALNVWLPDAEAGDAKAQTYVGEIFERGLGLPPDFEAAIQWYRKAATQGYSRAQVNLGFMYERGLGVSKDPKQAIQLYRQAAGLEGDSDVFTTPIEDLENQEAEIQARDQEIERLRREKNDLQIQLDETEQRFKERRERLEEQQRELDKARRQLEETPPAPATPNNPTGQADNQRLQRQLAEQQKHLEQRQKELERLQQTAQSWRQALEEAGEERIDLQNKIDQLEGQVDTLEKQLASQKKTLNQRKQIVATQGKELEDFRRSLQEAQQKTLAEENNTTIQKLMSDLEKKDQEVNKARQRIINLELELGGAAALDQEQDSDHQALEEKIRYLEGQLALQQTVLQTRQQEQREIEQQTLRTISSPTQREELEQLRKQLTTKEQQLQQSRQQIVELEIEVQSRQDEIEELQIIRNQGEQLATRSGGATISAPALPVETPDPGLDFGNYHALIIGNNDYQHLPDLKTAVNDAQAMEALLKSRYGFRTKLLINANRYDILSALNEFRAKLTENDNFLLYYAGHGELDQSNQRGHWLPVDSEKESTANWVSNVQVTDIINLMNAKHAMVITDSCYSGTMARRVSTAIEGGRSEEKLREWLKLMVNIRSRTVLTSGGVQPVLDGGGGSHSIFSGALLNVLRQNDGILEGPDLYRQVAGIVKARAKNLDVAQDPRYAPLQFAGDLGAPFFFRAISS